MGIRDIFKKIAFPHKYSSQSYIAYLRKLGMHVGNNVTLYSPHTIMIDEQRPWMVSIGNNVRITANCSILQHDFSWPVIMDASHEILGSSGSVTIGDNVFIGQRSVILKDAYVGDNVIK